MINVKNTAIPLVNFLFILSRLQIVFLFSFSIISNFEQKVKLFWKTKEYVEEYLLFFRSNISKNSYHGIWFLSYSELGD